MTLIQIITFMALSFVIFLVLYTLTLVLIEVVKLRMSNNKLR